MSFLSKSSFKTSIRSFLLLITTSLSCLFLVGCGTVLQVTYNSDPQGAVLYQGQQKIGYTPVTLIYPVSDQEKAQGVKVLPNYSVTWISGASGTLTSNQFPLNQNHFQQREITFTRPKDMPGYDKDVMFTLELERTQAMQRQAAAAEQQAAILEQQYRDRERREHDRDRRRDDNSDRDRR